MEGGGGGGVLVSLPHHHHHHHLTSTANQQLRQGDDSGAKKRKIKEQIMMLCDRGPDGLQKKDVPVPLALAGTRRSSRICMTDALEQKTKKNNQNPKTKLIDKIKGG